MDGCIQAIGTLTLQELCTISMDRSMKDANNINYDIFSNERIGTVTNGVSIYFYGYYENASYRTARVYRLYDTNTTLENIRNVISQNTHQAKNYFI